MNKVFYYASIATIISAIVFLVYFFYCLFFPFKAIDFNGKFTVDNKNLKPGETLYYNVDYCKYTDKPAHISKFLADGIYYPLPPTESNFEPGCHVIKRSMQIPGELPPGNEYHLIVTTTYHLNPFRDVSVTAQTENFNIQGETK